MSESTSNDKAKSLKSPRDAFQVVFMGLCRHHGSATWLKTSIQGVKEKNTIKMAANPSHCRHDSEGAADWLAFCWCLDPRWYWGNQSLKKIVIITAPPSGQSLCQKQSDVNVNVKLWCRWFFGKVQKPCVWICSVFFRHSLSISILRARQSPRGSLSSFWDRQKIKKQRIAGWKKQETTPLPGHVFNMPSAY